MQTFETAAIISLVDHLSGPLQALAGKVAGANNSFATAASKMADTGRHMTYQMTAPILAGAKHLTDHALEYSKIENTFRGVLANRFKEDANVSAKVEENIALMRAASEEAFKDSGGLSNALEFQKAALAATKAGIDMNGAAAIARQSVDLALAGRVDQHQAAEDLITLGNSFGIATKDAEGHTKSIKELNSEYGRLADMLATMSSNANMNHQQAVEALKLPGPLAHALGMRMGGGKNAEGREQGDMAVLGAITEAMSESGFKGSEAGVAQRSFLMGLMAPKSSAIPTLKAAGINYYDFVHMKESFDTGPAGFQKFATGSGFALTQAQASKAFESARKRAEESGDFYGDLTDELHSVLRRTGKKTNPVAPDLIAKTVNKFMAGGVDGFDVGGFVVAARAAGLTPGQMKNIWEGRQAPRLESFLKHPEKGEFDPMAFAMERMFGRDWENVLKNHRGDPKFLGNARKMAEEHAKGLEGAYTRMHASWERLQFRLYDAGVFDGVANGLSKIADAVSKIADSNPGALKSAAEGLVALAAVGPALWIGGRLLQVAAGLSRIGMAAAGLVGLATGAKAAQTAAKGAAAAAAGVESAAAALGGAIVALGATMSLVAANIYKQNNDIAQNFFKPGKPGESELPGALDPAGANSAAVYNPNANFVGHENDGIGPFMPPTDKVGELWGKVLDGIGEAIKSILHVPGAAPQPTETPKMGPIQPGGVSDYIKESMRNIDVKGTVEGEVNSKSHVDVEVKVDNGSLRAFVTNIITETAPALIRGTIDKLGTSMRGSNATTPAAAPVGVTPK